MEFANPPSPKEIDRIRDLADAANRREVSIQQAIREAVGPPNEIGTFFAIGTPESKFLHDPFYQFNFFSHSIANWCYMEKPGVEEKPTLVVTKLSRVAIISALFGDINEHTQSEHLENCTDPLRVINPCACPPATFSTSIIDRPRPHFGWDPDPHEEEGVALHALPELINKAHKLSGFIDIVEVPWLHTAEPLPEFGVGMYKLTSPLPRIATIHVLGRDLPETRAVTYPLNS